MGFFSVTNRRNFDMSFTCFSTNQPKRAIKTYQKLHHNHSVVLLSSFKSEVPSPKIISTEKLRPVDKIKNSDKRGHSITL